MILPRIRRLAVCLAVLALVAMGCSSTSTKRAAPHQLTQEEADDLIQMIAATMALDLGGWMVEIDRAIATRLTEGDTLETFPAGPAPITHNLRYRYTVRSGGTSATWDTSVVSVEANNTASGTFALPELKGAYGHRTDISIFSADEDTMFFNSLAVDTSRFTIVSFVRSDTVQYFMDNFFDYEELRIHKDRTPPWPISGFAAWLIDARKLTGPGTSGAPSLLVEMRVTFDGTQTPPAAVADDLAEGTQYRYTVDLKTGVVARAP